jgi:two-component system phosphate regulon response regulator OmpR
MRDRQQQPAPAERAGRHDGIEGSEARVLVVDTDSESRRALVQSISNQVVDDIPSADGLGRAVRQLKPDLVVLGNQGPGAGSIEACSRLRSNGEQVPIILLSGSRDNVDCVLGLELGADDFVVEPVSSRELVARMRAVIRRSRQQPAVDSRTAGVPVGDWLFDLVERTLSRGSQVRILSPVEYSILAELVSHPAVPVSRERLLDVSHADGTTPLRRSVDTAVMRLRRLVEPVPSEPVYLQTVYGRGYMFLPVGHRPPALM